jgi:predicted SnoaL-like aldol condensation-catalyzing enzyme
MPSMEERNVAALERWTYEVFEEGNLDLVEELMAPSYVGHGPAGTVADTPESYPARIASIRSNAPGLRYEMHDVIARGDRVALRYSTSATNLQTGKRERRSSTIAIWRVEDGRLAGYWVARRLPDAGPWPGESVPRERWSIASAESLTPDEEANLTTLNRWGDIRHNRSDDFDALPDLVTDPFILHGGARTQASTAAEVMRNAAAFAERYPGFTASYDDVFAVGDRAVVRFCYRYPKPSPERGDLQCGIAMYRFEDHRLAELWQVNLPNDVGWD